ncbi:hypothetical protein F66182_6058 [Fusarium sp. NRRL 66182]|nr:hypothetical protein F66182_6058 [Fusarium sp. NRRL 66182]
MRSSLHHYLLVLSAPFVAGIESPPDVRIRLGSPAVRVKVVVGDSKPSPEPQPAPTLETITKTATLTTTEATTQITTETAIKPTTETATKLITETTTERTTMTTLQRQSTPKPTAKPKSTTESTSTTKLEPETESTQSPNPTPVLEKCPMRSCPALHVFGARDEDTINFGFTYGMIYNLITRDHPNITKEAIDYPSCGGQESCGGISYNVSVRQGTKAVTDQVNLFHECCPETEILMVGYSMASHHLVSSLQHMLTILLFQGAHIIDNAFCGGTDPKTGMPQAIQGIEYKAKKQIKAVVLFGNQRFQSGKSYSHGDCDDKEGLYARPKNFVCSFADRIQSWCDWRDPYCCQGIQFGNHLGYVTWYGEDAMDFINSKVEPTYWDFDPENKS